MRQLDRGQLHTLFDFEFESMICLLLLCQDTMATENLAVNSFLL